VKPLLAAVGNYARHLFPTVSHVLDYAIDGITHSTHIRSNARSRAQNGLADPERSRHEDEPIGEGSYTADGHELITETR
jgi:hypothetical protein